jgi:hypothetical protein
VVSGRPINPTSRGTLRAASTLPKCFETCARGAILLGEDGLARWQEQEEIFMIAAGKTGTAMMPWQGAWEAVLSSAHALCSRQKRLTLIAIAAR